MIANVELLLPEG
uniref:Uncharacterized protein n=1 Tax=Megaselia scalaris TaxID=36166 RepID=T1GY93_MEGSC